MNLAYQQRLLYKRMVVIIFKKKLYMIYVALGRNFLSSFSYPNIHFIKLKTGKYNSLMRRKLDKFY